MQAARCGGREGKRGNVLHFGHVKIEVLLEHPSSDAQGGKSCGRLRSRFGVKMKAGES